MHARVEDVAKVLKLKPNFLALLDLDRVQRELPRLGIQELPHNDRNDLHRRIEQTLFRGGTGDRVSPILKVLVERCLDHDAVREFIQALGEKIAA
jgi:hypothetical protein